MNRTVTGWLLAISLSLNIGFIGTVVYQRLLSPSTASPSGQLNLPDYLKLTTEQRQRWQQLEPGFLHDLAINWREIRRHRETLVRNVLADQPDQARIDTEQARIAALQNVQQQRVIAQLLAERELLDDKQRARLMALLLDRYTSEHTEEELLHRE